METTNKNKIKKVIYDIGVLLAGSFLFAIAYNMFYTPGNVFTGGAGGMALAINKLTGFPTGITIILINIPLALFFVHFYGIKAGLKSIVGMISTSVAIDVIAWLDFLPSVLSDTKENTILFAVFGAVALGLGVGILFTRGFSTGGSDYIAFLLRIKIKNLPISKLIMSVDLVVITVASIITSPKNILTTLFCSMISILVESLVIQYVTTDNNKNKIAYIFTKDYEKVANMIVEKTGHSATLLEAFGWYKKENRKVIMVVVKKNEIHMLKELVTEMDDKVFVVLSDATETIGEGFKETVYDTAEIAPRRKRKKQ